MNEHCSSLRMGAAMDWGGTRRSRSQITAGEITTAQQGEKMGSWQVDFRG